HREHELRVVAHAERALREACPRVIEDELAVAVALEIGRRERQRLPVAIEAQVARHPAGLGGHASRLLERVEPRVAQEWRGIRLEQAAVAFLAERPHRRPRAYLQRHRSFRKRYAMSSSTRSPSGRKRNAAGSTSRQLARSRWKAASMAAPKHSSSTVTLTSRFRRRERWSRLNVPIVLQRPSTTAVLE